MVQRCLPAIKKMPVESMLRLSSKTRPQVLTGVVEEGQVVAAALVMGEDVTEGSAILSLS
jgi:hypothetical protein